MASHWQGVCPTLGKYRQVWCACDRDCPGYHKQGPIRARSVDAPPPSHTRFVGIDDASSEDAANRHLGLERYPTAAWTLPAATPPIGYTQYGNSHSSFSILAIILLILPRIPQPQIMPPPPSHQITIGLSSPKFGWARSARHKATPAKKAARLPASSGDRTRNPRRLSVQSRQLPAQRNNNNNNNK